MQCFMLHIQFYLEAYFQIPTLFCYTVVQHHFDRWKHIIPSFCWEIVSSHLWLTWKTIWNSGWMQWIYALQLFCFNLMQRKRTPTSGPWWLPCEDNCSRGVIFFFLLKCNLCGDLQALYTCLIQDVLFSPILGVWRGGSLLASSPDFESMCTTKAEYEEQGSERCSRRFFQWNIASGRYVIMLILNAILILPCEQLYRG